MTTPQAAATNGAAAIDPAQIDAGELARNMAAATDEQLGELMAGPMRGQILGEIFRRMAAHFRADGARDIEAVIHWRIGGREDRGRPRRSGRSSSSAGASRSAPSAARSWRPCCCWPPAPR